MSHISHKRSEEYSQILNKYQELSRDHFLHFLKKDKSIQSSDVIGQFQRYLEKGDNTDVLILLFASKWVNDLIIPVLESGDLEIIGLMIQYLDYKQRLIALNYMANHHDLDNIVEHHENILISNLRNSFLEDEATIFLLLINLVKEGYYVEAGHLENILMNLADEKYIAKRIWSYIQPYLEGKKPQIRGRHSKNTIVNHKDFDLFFTHFIERYGKYYHKDIKSLFSDLLTLHAYGAASAIYESIFKDENFQDKQPYYLNILSPNLDPRVIEFLINKGTINTKTLIDSIIRMILYTDEYNLGIARILIKGISHRFIVDKQTKLDSLLFEMVKLSPQEYDRHLKSLFECVFAFCEERKINIGVDSQYLDWFNVDPVVRRRYCYAKHYSELNQLYMTSLLFDESLYGVKNEDKEVSRYYYIMNKLNSDTRQVLINRTYGKTKSVIPFADDLLRRSN